MINLINVWVKRIIIAVIISTIIEMMIPNGSIKKYVQSIIGIYIAFIVVSPIFILIAGKQISLNTNIITNNNIYEIKQIDTDKYIENAYKDKLKEDIIYNATKHGFTVKELEIDIGNNSKINEIKLIVKNNEVERIEDIRIDIDKKIEKTDEQQEDLIELKEYLSETYDIPEERISLYAER